MSQYDFAKRIKRLISRECALTRRETKLAKESCKYHNNLYNLQMRYRAQEKELLACRSRMEQLQHSNEQFSKQLHSLETRMQTAIQQVIQLQEKANQQLAAQAEERQQMMAQMDRLRCLKVATNTYVNLHALPARLQGVTLHEEEHRTQWLPFCVVNPLQHSPEELQRLIWPNSSYGAVYSEAWEKMLFSSMRNKMRNA